MKDGEEKFQKSPAKGKNASANAQQGPFSLGSSEGPAAEPLGKMLTTNRTNPRIYLEGGKYPDVRKKTVLLFKATLAS